MESKLAVTLIMSVLLASWISDCEGFVGPFPTDGKRLLQKTGNLPASFTYLKWYTQTCVHVFHAVIESYTGVNN